ncbi:MAG: hypothetical protein NTU59_01985, partial [Coprothermobacterota bacterium]|nr:hypothetical protein [Coprothermobacterota bacterium]
IEVTSISPYNGINYCSIGISRLNFYLLQILLSSFSLIGNLVWQAPDIDIGETCRSPAFLFLYPWIYTQSFQAFSVGQ